MESEEVWKKIYSGNLVSFGLLTYPGYMQGMNEGESVRTE
jgi:hypothetical protein